MNFLKKIDHYLKINHPHIWRTRVHNFVWFSLILGNGLAVLLGILAVGRGNVFTPENLAMMHFSLAVLFGFVGLFWAIRLLRFKIRFPSFKTMLTTWLIYVLCVGSLGLNLAVFTSTIAYRTAPLYSDKVVEADYEYLRVNGLFGYSHKDDYSPFDLNVLKEKHRTAELFSIMERHEYNPANNIYTHDLDNLRRRLVAIKAAKTFVRQPILGTGFYNYKKRSFYHELLQMNWGMGIFALLFLPTLLFLLSSFGVQNVLISAFSTALIAGLAVATLEATRMLTYNEEARLLAVFAFVSFILGVTLAIGRYRLRSWNYIAGVFMLMLGVIFFTSCIVIIDSFDLERNILPIVLAILPISLIVSLLVAWAVGKRNDMPVF